MIKPENQIEIIDNFLPQLDFEDMQDRFSSAEIPWALNKYGVASPDAPSITCHPNYDWFMTHLFFRNDTQGMYASHTAEFINPILDRLDVQVFIRSKLNLYPSSPEIMEHGYHVDFHEDKIVDVATTCVFYINTCNGFTKFEDGTTVNSVENRMVIFPNSLMHTSTTCTDAKFRQVLNINYI